MSLPENLKGSCAATMLCKYIFKAGLISYIIRIPNTIHFSSRKRTATAKHAGSLEPLKSHLYIPPYSLKGKKDFSYLNKGKHIDSG